jgi:hypothetical protein
VPQNSVVQSKDEKIAFVARRNVLRRRIGNLILPNMFIDLLGFLNGAPNIEQQLRAPLMAVRTNDRTA